MSSRLSLALTVVGYALVALAVGDYFAAAFLEIDVWSIVGIDLQGLWYRGSAVIVGACGAVLVYLGRRLRK